VAQTPLLSFFASPQPHACLFFFHRHRAPEDFRKDKNKGFILVGVKPRARRRRQFMAQKKYDIMIHLWWEKQIRKITIVSEDTRIEMWFRNFGHITLEERRTRDVFSGIIEGLTGAKEDDLPQIFANVIKSGKTKTRERVRTREELLALVKQAVH
jgi:hypothetical protein